MQTSRTQAILHWFSILSPTEQAAVIACLDDEDRLRLLALLDLPSVKAVAATNAQAEWLVHRHFASAPRVFRHLLENGQATLPPALAEAVREQIAAVRQRHVPINEHSAGISDLWLKLQIRGRTWKATWVKFIKTYL